MALEVFFVFVFKLLPVHLYISKINLDTQADNTSAGLNDPGERIQKRRLFLWNEMAWPVQNGLDVTFLVKSLYAVYKRLLKSKI